MLWLSVPYTTGSICIFFSLKVCVESDFISRHVIFLFFFSFVDFQVMHFYLTFPSAHSCRNGNTSYSRILKWPHPLWCFVSLTAAGLVLPQHFDRFETRHWGIGSSPCSSEGCDWKAWLRTVQVQLCVYIYYSTGWKINSILLSRQSYAWQIQRAHYKASCLWLKLLNQ